MQKIRNSVEMRLKWFSSSSVIACSDKDDLITVLITHNPKKGKIIRPIDCEINQKNTVECLCSQKITQKKKVILKCHGLSS